MTIELLDSYSATATGSPASVVLSGLPDGESVTHLVFTSGSTYFDEPTVAGLSLSWSLVLVSPANDSYLYIHQATGNPVAGNITVTFSGGSPANAAVGCLTFAGVARVARNSSYNWNETNLVLVDDIPYIIEGTKAIGSCSFIGSPTCTAAAGYNEILDIRSSGATPAGLGVFYNDSGATFSGSIATLSSTVEWAGALVDLLPTENYYSEYTFDFSLGENHWVAGEDWTGTEYVDESLCSQDGFWVNRTDYRNLLYVRTVCAEIVFQGLVDASKVKVWTGDLHGGWMPSSVYVYVATDLAGPWVELAHDSVTTECDVLPYILTGRQISYEYVKIQMTTRNSTPGLPLEDYPWATIMKVSFVEFYDIDGVLIEPETHHPLPVVFCYGQNEINEMVTLPFTEIGIQAAFFKDNRAVVSSTIGGTSEVIVTTDFPFSSYANFTTPIPVYPTAYSSIVNVRPI